ncbi:hypothetical protein CYMTET_10098 [Cymbomonas tetramitiformis]|uniref:Uncharacterized protein n=1 Tax=Cymbomonas tetramitiformis TaxID=36881 RepID=A0AAE0LEH5_9CHLO|nr:hypothetical protein CYMTET_10098 [Cymbomonas tetramitiformis]
MLRLESGAITFSEGSEGTYCVPTIARGGRRRGVRRGRRAEEGVRWREEGRSAGRRGAGGGLGERRERVE